VSDETARADLRAELQEVEADLAGLRRSARQLREQIGEDEAGDYEDRASAIEAADEQDDLIGQLEDRRNTLLRRLGEQ
jgi:hypothetical protein